MLIIDPTEAMSSSRVPQDILDHACKCIDFEALTGADWLLSPLEKPMVNNLSTKLGELALRTHLKAGAILIQRKSGADILNFITDHNNILLKMRKWTDNPWLLSIGNYTCDEQEKLVVDGQRAGGSNGWSYWSYLGALHSWQLRGGYVDNLHRDNMLPKWLTMTVKAIEDSGQDVLVAPKKPSQQIVATEDDGSKEGYERAACISALATIPGISVVKAAAIADYCSGRLSNALMFLSNPSYLKQKKASPNWPKGIGSSAFLNASKWLGLDNGGEGYNQWYDTMIILREFPFKPDDAPGPVIEEPEGKNLDHMTGPLPF